MSAPVDLGALGAAREAWTDVHTSPESAAPLRAVDRWRSALDGEQLTARATTAVRGDEPNLRGHFPGLPIYPGVFVLETLCQVMDLALAGEGQEPVVLDTVRSIRFQAPLLGGDELTLEVSACRGDDGNWEVIAYGDRADGTRSSRINAIFRPRAAEPAAPAPPARLAASEEAPAREQHEIRALLPQRHPLLLVDRVLDLVPGESITTAKAVTASDPCYAGMPDGVPAHCHAYPFSLLIESMGQSAALLWLDGREPTDPDDGRVLMFVGARNFRFLGSACPGEVMRHEVFLESVIADTAFVHGRTWVDDRCIAFVDTLIATRRPVRQAPSTERG